MEREKMKIRRKEKKRKEKKRVKSTRSVLSSFVPGGVSFISFGNSQSSQLLPIIRWVGEFEQKARRVRCIQIQARFSIQGGNSLNDIQVSNSKAAEGNPRPSSFSMMVWHWDCQ